MESKGWRSLSYRILRGRGKFPEIDVAVPDQV